ncbi:putative poly(ADP)-ribose polymerase PARP [Aspergillus clavatus NRRL 1]|uniref:Poly [ADP-ribose] polymerase n=1 Tax=Aspergillus clavatus (strain ATCC 1007 / CBS 513.65 / DSM 816 / NCTC 3887 / NRRL 1 / QM 1276 / 107) TaxID=344612 RepID=A1CA63_ASPCL|nr:poly(ADP)-ribose polymerase PARP, putative [Aspergillus clavatus NRRL 1]EAW12631.1 poly(ADP)-ribose polymerase PARP, putative [Aspergillus clavatus NRRL 1]
MPPRSFKKLSIAVSGTFPGYKQADLKSIIEAHGASFAASVGDGCTHLVSTRKEVEKGSVKYKQACAVKGCDVVSLDWLLESDKARKPLAAKAYLLAPGGGDAETKAPKEQKKKRKIDAVDADGDVKVEAEANANGDANGDANGHADKAVKADADADDAVPSKKQKAETKALKVPVDEGCMLPAEVYIDDGLIWDATLNQTNSANNNNKFYRIQLLLETSSSYRTWTRWGRVGEFGSTALLGDGTLERAKAEFEKKFKDKSGLKWADRLDPPKAKKYTFIERNYEESDDEEDADDAEKMDVDGAAEDKKPVESKLPQAVQKLLTFIFNQQHFLSTMASMSYDAKKLPLGKLSKRTLTTGFQVLKDLSELVADPTLASSRYSTDFQTAAQDLSNRYFTIIPHDFGRNRPPVLNGDDQIKREVELLEALTDMGVANEIMKVSRDAEMINQLDRQYQGLGMQEMTPLARASTEYRELEAYLNNSRGSTHHLRYNVANIFRIERQGENDRFNASSYAKIEGSDRRLLWHGSRSTNFGGILSQGLRIAPPEAPVQGYMFGKGVYFADMSSKSANYCMPYNSANMGLLLLCDVEVGNPMFEQTHSNYNAGTDAKAAGKIATLGRGHTIPGAWKDAACVNPALAGVQMPDVAQPATSANAPSLMYNEYIVYDVAQIRQRYLFHVHMN